MSSVRELVAGRYELLEVVGRGGMGVVYRACDRVLGRPVAVKVLPAEVADDPVLVARFEREARATAALNHPNIVAVFDTAHHGDTRFIVMAYVAGRTLAQVLGWGQRPSVARAVQIGAQVADALEAAHRAGIIHRDIKPSNVMVDEAGAVKVLDFGIARATADTSLTQTAMVLGSAPYMAPEVARGEPADERSDIYSLGCVVYEVLTGRPPFTADVAVAVMHQHNTARPRPPRQLNPAVPSGLDALVLRILAKHPVERPQTAAELAADLRESLKDPSTAQTVRRPLARPPDRASGAARPRGLVHGLTHDWRLGAAGLVVVAVAALLLALLASSGGQTARHTGQTGRAAASGGRHASSRQPTTTAAARSTSTSSSTRTASTSSTRAPASPATVPAAAGTLTTLITQDLQAGAIDQHGHDLLNHLQDILGSYEQTHAGDALHKLDDLTKHLADLSQHGDIRASALRALLHAIANLRAAMARASPAATGPAGGSPPNAPAKKH